MADVATTSIPTGATLATTIAYANSNITLLKNAVTGSMEGRGAATPNLASRTVDETTVAHNASVCTWSAESGFNGFVVTGLTYVSASGLTATFLAGTAWIRQTSSDPDQNRRIVVSSNVSILLTASSTNYVYLKVDGTLGAALTSTIPADTLLLNIVTTDGTTVTTTSDQRVTTSTSVSKHFRSSAFWPAPTSSTNIRIPPGSIEIAGTLFEPTTNNDLDVSTATNFISGARTSNVWVYAIAANNGGAIKLGLTTSAPSAMTVTSATATAGSTGRLQYRVISGLAYRYLGANRLVAGGNLLRGIRANKFFFYNSAQALLTTGTSTSFTSVTGATRWPPQARLVSVTIRTDGGTDGIHAIRENGTTGTGFDIQSDAADGSTIGNVVCSSAQKVDYRISGGDSMDIDAQGYSEELD